LEKYFLRSLVIVSLCFGFLAACSEPDQILPGKREAAAEAFGLVYQNKKRISVNNSIDLAPMKTNFSWTRVSSAESTDYSNILMGEKLSEAWSVSIGTGESKKKRLITDPIFVDDKIFTLDVNSIASAFSADGKLIWRRDLTPLGEKTGETFGGGLTFGQGQIFVTLGYGFLLSLDPQNGQEIWSQRLRSNGNTIPVYSDGLVYLVSGDSKAWAVSADDGRIRWNIDAIGNETNLVSSNSPATSKEYTVFGFGSGEIYTTFKKGGYVLWRSSLSGQDNGRVVSAIDDIVASPVIVGQNVFVADGSGQVVSFKIQSGKRNWTAPFGSSSNLWVAGKSLFFISNTNHLVRLEINTGNTVWMKELQSFSSKRFGGSKKFIRHYGPIIAGNQIVLASSDGFIRFYNPETGEQITELKIKNGATTNPIVVNETLYLITQDGNLRAFR
jgi:outer membrane protein assembly factor BamB